jgi:hypothetical protein
MNLTLIDNLKTRETTTHGNMHKTHDSMKQNDMNMKSDKETLTN